MEASRAALLCWVHTAAKLLLLPAHHHEDKKHSGPPDPRVAEANVTIAKAGRWQKVVVTYYRTQAPRHLGSGFATGSLSNSESMLGLEA
ncbi:hypothetical protein TREES_T100012241 [Tupaia chinensis]|uniref:Secreted protein n=1 Tax=Tupaia chinensis TaxID=246437 RepID=L9JG64_TUPCH|nr:hypothetical protein TREES_T100012241 [Tupaia chinensis]